MVEVDLGVIMKLVLFSIAIVVLPVGVLMASLHGYFDGRRACSLTANTLESLYHVPGHTACPIISPTDVRKESGLG